MAESFNGVAAAAALLHVEYSSGPLPPQADLSITKTDSADPVNAGDNLSYTVTVTNNGPDPATNVVVTDTLPAGVTFVLTSGCAESPGGGVPNCSLGTIANGTSKQYSIMVTVNAATSGTITNSASVAASEQDPNTANNSTSENTQVNGSSPTVSAVNPDTGPTTVV